MATKVQVHSYNLMELVNFIKDKKVAVPEFQRGFVWKAKQIKSLFDSLINNYPIGSVIIWRTSQRIDARTLNGEKLPNRDKYLILDGQQRLASLYYLTNQKVFSQHTVRDKFHQICDTRHAQLIDFENFFIDKNEKGEKILEYHRGDHCDIKAKKLQNLIGQSYKFPVIVVSLNNYRRAIEVFERINQAGTKIATESIFLSETWTQHTDFEKILRNWKAENVGTLTKDIDTVIFIHVFALIYQLDKNSQKKQYPMEVSVKTLKRIAEEIREQGGDKYNNVFTACINATGRAVQFLSSQYGIVTVSELPSQTLLTVLSVFFYYHPRPITEQQNKELNKWFWRSSLTSRYIGSGYNKNIGPDAKAMRLLAVSENAISIDQKTIYPSDFDYVDLNRGRSAVRNIVRLALWQKKPKFINGEFVSRENVGIGQNNPENDHFYPFDLHRKDVLESDVNNILNLHLLDAGENVRKGKKLPSVWLEERMKEFNPDERVMRKYFESELLPFQTLKQLKLFERPFFRKGKKRYVEQVNKKYRSFKKKRFFLFKDLLERLQDGKI